MLHIYSIAVRADKNDMAIEPEGMDRKEKGKEGMVKEWVRGGNFANGTDFERQTQTSHTPPPTLLFTPFPPTSENPLYSLPPSSQPFPLLFLYYFHPPDKITHFLPSYLFCTVLSHSSSMANRYTSTLFLPYSLLLTPASSLLQQQQHPPDSTKFLWNSTSQMSFCLVGF